MRTGEYVHGETSIGSLTNEINVAFISEVVEGPLFVSIVQFRIISRFELSLTEGT